MTDMRLHGPNKMVSANLPAYTPASPTNRAATIIMTVRLMLRRASARLLGVGQGR